MKKTILLSAFVALAAIAGAANAEGTVSYNVAGTSNYVWRGYSQTSDNGAIQGGVDYANGMYYAGTWASMVDFGDSTDAELDVYGGIKPTYGDYSFDLGVIVYGYLGEPEGSDYTFGEVKAAVSHPLGKGTVGGAVYYSPEFFGAVGPATYYEVNGSYPITDKLAVSGALGSQESTKYEKANYTTLNVGLTYAVTDTWSVDGRVSTNDLPEMGHADNLFALTVKKTF